MPHYISGAAEADVQFRTNMSKTARRSRISAVIKLLSEQFPQTFNHRDPRPLKVGIRTDVLTALGEVVKARDLKSALRA
jgi:sRNA-binding protein